ncbi:TPA: hypothetical protein OMT82_000418 [Enterobacter cloacae]|uniref:hypothetical protein n=1 Tax=Klebsiella variicola TaxID=244366 RepID=UPI0011C8350B|nr:hypothetical protein [Klebsiella variicola]HCR0901186.1 hypothetical protein [Enterobacter cloacae]HCR0905066.1 hypothetical protein [Enterobacter cloacae]
MNDLSQFPCYDQSVLSKFSFQSIKPVSVTLPYDKALSGSKLIKKKVDKEQGELIVYSFSVKDKPNVNDDDSLTIELLEEKKEVKVLHCFFHVYKGYRVYSCVCQIQKDTKK